MQETVHVNGNRVDPLEEEADRLRDMLAPIAAEKDQLEQRLVDLKARARRIQIAIDALTGEPKSKSGPAPKKQGDWQVSEERIQFIKGRFEEFMATRNGEPETKTAFGQWLKERGDGISSDTIQKAFEVLREREVVRITGATRGGGKFYALMP